jgi:hypothetical protein
MADFLQPMAEAVKEEKKFSVARGWGKEGGEVADALDFVEAGGAVEVLVERAEELLERHFAMVCNPGGLATYDES